MSPERRAEVIAELRALCQPGRRLDDAPWTTVRIWRRLVDRAARMTGKSDSACYRKLPLIGRLREFWLLVELGDYEQLRRGRTMEGVELR